MDKVHKLMNPFKPDNVAQSTKTNWTKCFICQIDKSEILRCPAESKRHTNGAGYKTISTLLMGFRNAGCFPSTINLAHLDNGEGMEATLEQYKARFHESCRFNKTKLQRAKNRKIEPADNTYSDMKFTRQRGEEISSENRKAICFFCDLPSQAGSSLCTASTFGLDAHVRHCALKLEDKPLLAKLSAGDLIAQDAMYHIQCLVSLYNRARDKKSTKETESEQINHGIAFAELISYIEDARTENEFAPIFKLVDLCNLYYMRMKQLGSDLSGRIHSTKLKNRVLAYFPDMEAHKQGRDVMLIFNNDVGSALSKACEYDADSDAVHLAKAANIVRRDIFKMKNHFNGSFGSQCQEESVPVSLLALVAMVTNGPNIKAQSSFSKMPQPILTVAQLIMYNSLVRRCEYVSGTALNHSQERETPLPIYLGILIHAKTRKRELIETLHELGLSISYDRVLDISSELGNEVCHHYEMENAVIPLRLKGGLFTTSAVDNIDHNPSSTTAHDSFHGTGISLFQHPEDDFMGMDRNKTKNLCAEEATKHLPESYTSITPVPAIRTDCPLPIAQENLVDYQVSPLDMVKEHNWLKHVSTVLAIDNLQGDEIITWAVYNASLQEQTTNNCGVTISSLLPLFPDPATSVAMIRHSMDIVKMAVERLNPGQIPIITFDQPLYALAKQIQWNWPKTYGEDQFIILFGGLHIEMTVLKMLGKLLEESGWTGALVQADITTAGKADSFIKGSHVTRARRAHQITASSLYLLMQQAYNVYSQHIEDSSQVKSLEEWCKERSDACAQFRFWFIILKLQLLLMTFVRAIREGDFHLYIEGLSKIVPWFFSLDHTHYARWIPVHLRDMISLKKNHPTIYEEFMKGKFVAKKSKRAFSAIAIDQAHEQNNALVKGDGGAIGLTENSKALHRWMVSGPEIACLIEEFNLIKTKRWEKDERHHEANKHSQLAFAKNVKSLTHTIQHMGNPFSENSSDLLVLDSRNIIHPAVAETLLNIEKIGVHQYELYVTERLINKTTRIVDPIRRNNFHLFSNPPIREKSSKQLQLTALKNDCSLFSRLYIASQIRNGDLDDFFRHENQAYPPALSKYGSLRTGTKADLLTCLEKLTPEKSTTSKPTVEMTILDGAAIVNMLQPGFAKTFEDYANIVFIPYIKSQLQNVRRLDIIWDVYRPDSLKSDTRSKRGKGIRKRVEPSSPLPKNWLDFLRVNENKTELFSFLATTTLKSIDTNKQVISTNGTNVLAINRQDIIGLAPCTHEEADTRILLHLCDAVKQGYNKAEIRTVDTDVVVLAITSAQRLNIEELWVAFGVGKNFRVFAAHELARSLGRDRCTALPMFHAITGCDTVSFFGGRGKKTAWETWNAYGDITATFCTLADRPSEQTVKEMLKPLERFIVLLYERSSSDDYVNEARKHLFSQKGRAIENIPPTQDALIQHTKRAVYQAGYCWAQMMVATPHLPLPSDWGWKKKEKGGWEISWTTLPEASQVCSQLIRCGCIKGCTRQCTCRKAFLKCTALCSCGTLCSD